MWVEVKRDTINIDGGESKAVYIESQCNSAVSKSVTLLLEDEGECSKTKLAENECIALRDKLNEWFPVKHECKCGGRCHGDVSIEHSK